MFKLIFILLDSTVCINKLNLFLFRNMSSKLITDLLENDDQSHFKRKSFLPISWNYITPILTVINRGHINTLEVYHVSLWSLRSKICKQIVNKQKINKRYYDSYFLYYFWTMNAVKNFWPIFVNNLKNIRDPKFFEFVTFPHKFTYKTHLRRNFNH